MIFHHVCVTIWFYFLITKQKENCNTLESQINQAADRVPRCLPGGSRASEAMQTLSVGMAVAAHNAPGPQSSSDPALAAEATALLRLCHPLQAPLVPEITRHRCHRCQDCTVPLRYHIPP